MATVESWFLDFVFLFTGRLDRDDWPAPAEVFWEPYRRAFVDHGVTQEVADIASSVLATHPPKFKGEYLQALMAEVKVVWASSEVIPAGSNDRETAFAQMLALFGNKPCPDCDGQGFATRYRHASLDQTRSDGKPVAPSITLYCRCPFGRWIERRHREGSPESRLIHRRIPDMADHPALWGMEFRSPPVADGAPECDATMSLRELVDAMRLARPSRAGYEARTQLNRSIQREPAEPTADQLYAAQVARERVAATLKAIIPNIAPQGEPSDGQESAA